MKLTIEGLALPDDGVTEQITRMLGDGYCADRRERERALNLGWNMPVFCALTALGKITRILRILPDGMEVTLVGAQ